jgi:hypothetical protein
MSAMMSFGDLRMCSDQVGDLGGVVELAPDTQGKCLEPLRQLKGILRRKARAEVA